jgi:hypothetical protein
MQVGDFCAQLVSESSGVRGAVPSVQQSDWCRMNFQRSARLYWISRGLYFAGALLFVANLPLPWAGIEVRDSRGQVVQRVSWPGWNAGAEATAALVLVVCALLLGCLTIRNRQSWPYGLSAVLEVVLLLLAAVLIFLHGAHALDKFWRHGEHTHEGKRVIGPYIGHAATFLMLLGSSLKLFGILRARRDPGTKPEGRRRVLR